MLTKMLMLALACGAALSAQTKVGGACPYLKAEETAALLGAGVKAEPLVSSGPNAVCTFVSGQKRLSLSVGGSGPMAAYYKMQMQKLRDENKGKDEAGMGEYAVSFSEGGEGGKIMALKGGKMYTAQVSGAGSGAKVFEQLRGLMKLALTR